MSVSKMTGTPWHAEKVHREDGDDRRYKGRCKYYEYDENQCVRRNGKCIGSAHCSEYKAMSDTEFQKKQLNYSKRKVSKKHSDEDDYWY